MNILFFDDTRLYYRNNLTREYGTPELVKSYTYENPEWIYQWPLGQWKENGIWQMPVLLMYYTDIGPGGQNMGTRYSVVMLKSTDGENWEADNRSEQFGYTERMAENQCFAPADVEEPAYIFYDKDDVPERRYKMLSILVNKEDHWVEDIVYCSADAFRWHRMNGAVWSCRGAEPGLSAYRIEEKHINALALRPTWGDRRICVSTTDHFESFSYPQIKVMPDSLDAPQTEFYGMRVRPYKGYYIGMLWQYHTRPTHENKYWGGKMNCQLTYSLDGLNWFRSLRKPFIGNGEEGSYNAGMVFPGEIAQVADGSLRITAAAFPKEHPEYKENGTLVQYQLREDGFIKLVAGEEEAELCTRPVVLKDGVFDINIKCSSPVTCCIYNHGGRNPIPGFTFEESVPFTGDDTHWVPKWKNADLSSLKDKPVCIHLKFANGEIYAINGNIVPITHHEACRYAMKQVWVDPTGF